MIGEIVEECPVCHKTGKMKKLLSKPSYMKNADTKSNNIGDLTKEYIELNREILEDEKKKTMELEL